MGNFHSKGDAKKTKPVKNLIKVVTLGTGGSGKSTFIKCMRIVHCPDGFNDDERISYRDIIRRNIMFAMTTIIKVCIDDVTDENRKHARFIQDVDIGDPWDEKVYKKIKALWSEPVVQETYKKGEVHSVIESQNIQLDYLMKHIDRYGDLNFMPTNEDILHARQRTTGSISVTFKIQKFQWQLTDVGGQEIEQEKWGEIIMKQNISVAIFFVSLEDYNVATEEPDCSKMDATMKVFEEVVNSEQMKELCFVLFLNKNDIFTSRIRNNEGYNVFKTHFPTYSGPQDPGEAGKFIFDLFRNCIHDEHRKKELYGHFTCALDTQAMSAVFDAVREYVFSKRLERSGLKFT